MASSYVNNLRLNEMATGDASGTWGTITNTNLELIGEALGFGTEAITTNADTHTSTIADGASDGSSGNDGARAMYLKYTGTLDSACTITIAPNDIRRLQFIENGTSGSQNIIISQGSGANVTIPPGDTKAVYLDGAGSGAAVVDAFASLNVVDLKVEDDLTVTDDLIVNGDIDLEGSIDVNGTANLDVVDIDGAVDMASTLGVTGVVTANAGVVVDNITIDGQEIDVSSGDLTLDVAGDIILDADGSDISLRDGGTEFGRLSLASSGLQIFSPASDADIFFKGNDGGSTVTALTLDMSIGGVAKFGAAVQIPQYLTHLDDTDTFLEFGTNQIDLYAGNAKAVTIGSSQVIINQDSADMDFRVESNSNANMFFVDASANAIGINTDAPDTDLHLSSTTGGTFRFERNDTTITSGDTYGKIEFEGQDASGGNSGGVRAEILVQGAGTGTQGETEIIFKTSHTATTRNSEKLKIGNLGDITITDGNLIVASGHGIDFSATANSSGSMSSELLSDYEEGSFTATFSASGATIGQSVSKGTYTKIGNQVNINIYVQCDGTVSLNSNALSITGLPFTSASTAQVIYYGAPAGMRFISMSSDYYNLMPYINNNDNTVQMYQHGKGQSPIPLPSSGLSNSSGQIFIQMFYYV